jgi:hypothetical protein
MLDLRSRRGILATAALRASVAWTRRDTEPRAWGEVARMAGVVMHVNGPGRGLTTPAELVAALHQPLSLLLDDPESTALDELVLVGPEGELSDDAMEIVCDYTQALFDGEDPASQWLPSWAWQRAEQIQRQLFQDLIQAGDATVYTASRRFLVEHPAGDVRALIDARRAMNARQVANYIEIPRERLHRFSLGEDGLCWWPCPVCRWPMKVNGQRVGCTYRPHAAQFLLADIADALGRPQLVQVSVPALVVPVAHGARSAQCVEPAVWRFVTVPGVPELDLERRLLIPDLGLKVKMYPLKDMFDALVAAPDGRSWSVDVKDHADAMGIVDDPPRAEYVAVPSYRRAQVNQLRRLLPGKSVHTVAALCREIRGHASRGSGRL